MNEPIEKACEILINQFKSIDAKNYIEHHLDGDDKHSYYVRIGYLDSVTPAEKVTELQNTIKQLESICNDLTMYREGTKKGDAATEKWYAYLEGKKS